jgi:YVTN family beta-propeller protein
MKLQLVLAAAVLLTLSAAAQSNEVVYVANSGANVSAYNVDPTNGSLTQMNGSPFPNSGGQSSYFAVHPTKKFLYVADSNNLAISTYSINSSTGALQMIGTPIGLSPTPPFGGMYIGMDPKGRFLYAATVGGWPTNVYGWTIDQNTGSLSAISSGMPATAGSFDDSHAFCVTVDPTGRFAYVCNQDDGTVSSYVIDQVTGALTNAHQIQTGLRPRSVTVEPTGQFAYVVNYGVNPPNICQGTYAHGTGQGCVVRAFHIDQTTGVLSSIGINDSVPAGTNPIWSAIDPAGKVLYAVNIDSNDVSAFSIDASTGALTPVGIYPAGQGPYSINVDPSGSFVYVANVFDGTTYSYSRDSSGALAQTGLIPGTAASDVTSLRMATTWTVTSVADDGSAGTLRDAIANANSGDTIRFDVTGTITLTQGTLEIGKELTISGPGADSLTISGGHAYTVFQIDSGTTVTISGLTMQDGLGGANGGDISNYGTLTITNSTLLMSTPSNGEGGGIFNTGTLTVANSSFFGNLGFGVAAYGGGIFNKGTAAVDNSTFSSLGVGGFGGAIYNAVGATLVVTNSTFWRNAANAGGAIFNNDGSGGTTVVNSTLVGNGGIYNLNATTRIKNTILANNSDGGNCYVNGGAVVSYGHNLSDDNSCASSFTKTGDLNNTPAGLDPAGLKNNGGSTETIALLSNSSAVDAIAVSPVNYCTGVDGTTPVRIDQRGITRPYGSACDIGAFEIRAASVAITLSPNPSVFGQQVAIAATVSSNAGTPTGTVTFNDGTTALGTGTLNGSGQATFIKSTLTAGMHTVSVGYGGDANFDPSPSLAVAQIVAKAATTTTLNSSPNPSTTGQTVNFIATVAGQYGGAATGTVTFKEGTNKTLSTASLVNGSATLPLSTLGAGTHTVTAVYGGDPNSNGSTSPAITQTVTGKTATTTTVSSSLNPSFVGQSVTFTATVSPSAATGTVTFKAGQTVLGTASLSSGTAAFSTSSLSAGSFNIVAVYGGDAQFASSTSGSLTQTVNKASTTTVLGSTPNPSSVGQLVTFTAKVTSSTGVTPSGTLSFNEGGTTLWTGALDGSGTATFSTLTLSKGKHNVKAVYGATSAFSGSTSAVITQIVQ